MSKNTLWFVTDIETTMKQRIAFDIAWKVVDRKGKVYDQGSYLVKEAFKLDVPYFVKSLGEYLQDAYDHNVTPATMIEIRERYNDSVSTFLAAGHRVIFAAYNAGFDSRYLGETSRRFTDKGFLSTPIWILDLWHYWVLSAPQAYNYVTPKGNPKTSAECVYRYETCNPEFVERHIAWSDCIIEVDILLTTLRRKKKMPLVSRPDQLNGQPWRLMLGRKRYQNPEGLIVVEQ